MYIGLGPFVQGEFAELFGNPGNFGQAIAASVASRTVYMNTSRCAGEVLSISIGVNCKRTSYALQV